MFKSKHRLSLRRKNTVIRAIVLGLLVLCHGAAKAQAGLQAQTQHSADKTHQEAAESRTKAVGSLPPTLLGLTKEPSDFTPPPGSRDQAAGRRGDRQARTFAVVDAGSSGSRVYIYQSHWDPASQLSQVQERASLKIEPGLSALSKMQDKKTLAQYLKPLADFILRNKPRHQASVTIHWFSTAGMRLVDPKTQVDAYLTVRQYFEQHHIHVAEMATIPGWKEGALMWLGTNYHLNKLTQPVGIIDMGGASTQLTLVDPSSKHLLTLNTKPYPLYSKSFLGLGSNEARHQASNQPACFAKGFILPDGSPGRGNFQHCLDSTVKPLLKLHGVDELPIKIPSSLNFVAYDGFYYLFEHQSHVTTFTLKALKKMAQQICAVTWHKGYNKGKQVAYDACFNASYYYGLLKSYGFGEDQLVHIANGSWTLGAALLIANKGSLQ